MVPEPLNINGQKLITVAQFAEATHRSSAAVRQLMSKGNRIRKINVVHFSNKPYIPFSEIEKYPFTVSGRASKTIYKYVLDVDGQGYIPFVVEG